MATEVTKLIFNPLTGNFDTIVDVSGLAPLIQSSNGKALQSNSSTGAIEPSSVTNTELGYVSGVTSNIQTQINSKQATGNYITGLTGHIVATGPGSVTSTIQPLVIVNSMIASAATIALTKLAATTASRALASDASGFITPSATTSTELGYVSGVTSSIQTQINAKFTLPALTAGSVVFSNGTTLSQNNANFFWDNTNNRLGIGTSSPATKLVVRETHPSSGQKILISEFGTNSNGALRILSGNAGDQNIGTWLTWNTTNSRWEAQATTTVGAAYFATGIDGSINFFTQPSAAVTAGDPLTFNNTLRLSGNGNVGIGTTTPAKTLSVFGATEVAGGYGSLPSSPVRPVLGGGGASPNVGSLAWGDGTGYKFHLGTSVASTFTPRVTFNDSGNVGIGTQTPSEKLDIGAGSIVLDNTYGYKARLSSGTVANLMRYTAGNQAILGPNDELRLDGSFTAQPPGALILNPQQADSSSVIGVKINTQNSFLTSGAKLLSVQNAGTEKAFINKDGGAFFNSNVGIGDTNPGSNLSVSKSQDALTQLGITNLTDGTSSRAGFSITSGSAMTMNVDCFSNTFSGSGDAAPNTGRLLTTGLGGLALRASNASSTIRLYIGSTERMRVDATGGVGIGTTTPNTSSLVDITSTTKGFLQPRMTTTQRNAITTPATGLSVYDTDLNKPYYYNGTAWVTFPASTAPTSQTFTSGSGTYTTPAGCTYIIITAIGGGGGGGGSGTAGTGLGTDGGTTTFGSVITMNGGAAGRRISSGGVGGTGSTSAPVVTYTILNGAVGGGVSFQDTASVSGRLAGATGGAGPFGGAGGAGSYQGVNGFDAVANTGAGGGGGGSNNVSASSTGSGGGSGAYVRARIVGPSATYSYAVGAAGAAGAAGTSGLAGGAGGSGIIIVEEFYT